MNVGASSRGRPLNAPRNERGQFRPKRKRRRLSPAEPARSVKAAAAGVQSNAASEDGKDRKSRFSTPSFDSEASVGSAATGVGATSSTAAAIERVRRWLKYDGDDAAAAPDFWPPSPPSSIQQSHTEPSDAGGRSASARTRTRRTASSDASERSTAKIPSLNSGISELPSSTESESASSSTSAQGRREGPIDGRVIKPVEADLAFVKFIAGDAILRGYMLTGATRNMTSRLRDYGQRADWKSKTLYDKIKRWRAAWLRLRQKLSSTARVTPTTQWNNQTDWDSLEESESHCFGNWLTAVHDEIYVPAAQASAQAASRPGMTKSSYSPKASTSRLYDAVPDTTKQASTSPPLESAEIAELQGQLDEQSRELGLLEAQRKRTRLVLTQQAELLQSQADRADLQAQRTARQLEKLARVESSLKALRALVRERT